MNCNYDLTVLNIDDVAVIKEIDLEGPIHKRVCELGFLPGVRTRCVLKAPSGSPIAFEIKGSIVALRKKDAKHIYCIITEGIDE